MLKTFNYVQPTPASVWTINHNLGTKPAHDIAVFNGGAILKKVLPMEAHHVSDNQLVITFSSPQYGTARLAGGEATRVLDGSVFPEAPWTPVAPSSAWTQDGNYWSLAGDVATSPAATLGSVVPGSWVEVGDTLHGPLLPAGTYADVLLSAGWEGFPTSGQHVAFLGVSDATGPIIFSQGDKAFVTWYWNGTIYRQGIDNQGVAPSGLTGPQRYRIASKTGGEIAMSKVSADGTTLQGTALLGFMTGGFNASALHVVVLTQNDGFGYAAPSATIYAVQSGSGGL